MISRGFDRLEDMEAEDRRLGEERLIPLSDQSAPSISKAGGLSSLSLVAPFD